MALETLALLSLAGNIVQFVEIGSKAISAFREIHHSVEGSLRTNEELELIAKDLKNLLEGLTGSFGMTSDPYWSAFNVKCSLLATELITTLDKLKPSGGISTRLDTLKVSVKILSKRSKIQDLETSIWKLRDQICFRLNILLL
jgi:hypothetical protein